jgi:outer membrane lipoprotein-sorting protein
MSHSSRYLTIALVVILTALGLGCTAAPTGTNANLSSNANLSTNANAAASTATTATAAFSTPEPASYSATMSISGQWSGGQRQGNIPTLQFEFAKMDTNRRWTFNLPQPVGPVTYIEKPNLKYLVLPSRNQYVELKQEELGFQLGSLMTPATMIDRLKSRTQYETLGTETVNGRAATKYRFAGAADTRTQAGAVQADSLVYVDQSTGLPLRAEINTTTTSGAGARIVIETRDIQTNPAPTLFEVPQGMKLVTTQELKQQVQGFVDAIRVFAEMMRQQGGAPAAATTPPAANANANANR